MAGQLIKLHIILPIYAESADSQASTWINAGGKGCDSRCNASRLRAHLSISLAQHLEQPKTSTGSQAKGTAQDVASWFTAAKPLQY